MTMKPPILFLCDRNTARSVMAASLVPGAASAGLSPDTYVDPFAASVMKEQGIDITSHDPRAFTDADLASAGTVIALSMDAFAAAQAARAQHGFTLEYWDLPAIPSHDATRDTILDGYRHILNAIREHLGKRD